ncbi:MAG: hypothetical protein U9P07_05095, partial [Pseudomonadota bacterium]|nr:hypothetical protein [Pseudomonadota bacterium]
HKLLINQVLKSADFIDIIICFFFIIDGHRYGRTTSATFLQEQPDGQRILALKISGNLFLC